MAEKYTHEASRTGNNASGECSNSDVELKIKTLDSRIFSFQVEKNMPVSLFKEKIANEIGVPVGQQRLIFRGKVLKDDHLLSEYHVDNGHTLHLVERQPAQSQPSSDTNSGERNGNSSNRGDEANASASRNRVGQISHSVVLGTFNVGDQGEGIVPDLSRVIGAVLNSFGVGGQTTINGPNITQSSTLAPQGNVTDGMHGRDGNQSQTENQTQSSQTFSAQPFQFSPQVVQIPMATAAVPSFNTPIPDSLNTLSEFMNRLEQALCQNGLQESFSSANVGDLPRLELPYDPRGLPTPETLAVVLRHAQRLLSEHAAAALSHIAGRLGQERDSPDPAVRGHIQAESVQVGLAMQHLGALLLELGRTILTLRMGQSPAESSVNAGPAVYVSSSGPNPIMVQPFPLQTNTLFGGSNASSNLTTLGPLGMGHAPRHINIHIHAGTAVAPVVSGVGSRTMNAEGVQGDGGSSTGSGGSASMRVLPMRNVIAAAVPARPTGVAISTSTQPVLGVSVSQPPTEASLSSVIAEVNSRIRNLVGGMQGESQASSGNAADSGQPNNAAPSGVRHSSATQPVLGVSVSQSPREPSLSSVITDVNSQTSNSIDGMPRESQVPSGNTADDGPLNDVASGGAGDSSLTEHVIAPESEVIKSAQVSNNETKILGEASSSSKRVAPMPEDLSGATSRSNEKGAHAVPLGLGLGGLGRKIRTKLSTSSVTDGEATCEQDMNSRTSGQQILQSLVSRSSAINRTNAGGGSSLPIGPGVSDQNDAANAMSQVIQSPALNGLLARFSEQTGVGSPDVLRNMLQQLTQNPQIMNTVGQLAQQVDAQDLGSMFSGLGGQGGGVDLSRMVQQMMPVVSRALGGQSGALGAFPPAEPESQCNERTSNAADGCGDHDIQAAVQQVGRRVENFDSSEDVFRAVIENAVQLHGGGRNLEELVDELCCDNDIVDGYMEILKRDFRQRFQGNSGQGDS